MELFEFEFGVLKIFPGPVFVFARLTVFKVVFLYIYLFVLARITVLWSCVCVCGYTGQCHTGLIPGRIYSVCEAPWESF